MATPLATLVLGETGLAHFYELAETTGTSAADSKGTQTGTYNHGPTLNQAGIITSESLNCPSFASTQFVNLDTTAIVPTGTASFTWEAWVYPTSATIGNMRVLGADDAAGTGPSLMYDGPNNQWHCWRTTAGTQLSAKAGAINTTYHIVMTYDGKMLKLYVNGQSRGGIIDTTSITTIGGTMNIGATGDYGSFWQGKIQYAALYTVCLTGSQIKTHYRQGLNSLLTAHNAHWYGAYLNSGVSWDYSPPSNYGELDTWTSWATNAGATSHKPGLFHCFCSYAQSPHFPIALAQQANQRGAVLMVTWDAWDPGAAGTGGRQADQPAYSLYNIINNVGGMDTYITTWANDVKSYGLPVLIRLFHEFNGDYYPWSTVQDANNGNQSDYATPNTEALVAQAFQHVVALFDSAGVFNAKFVWCPNIFVDNYSDHPFTSASYPGDTYVDYVGLDGYQSSGNSGTNVWLPFFDLYSQSYDALMAITTTKGVMIPEMACTEDSTAFYTKAGWITQALGTDIPQSFPAMLGFVWEDDVNYPPGITSGTINSSTAAKSAFQAQIASSQYAVGAVLGLSAPTISSISPTSEPSGSSGITLTVNGSYLEYGSVVNWAGSARTTTYVSATQLTATINTGDLATAGTYAVTVATPGQATTGAITFTVSNSVSPPTLTSLSPSSATTGSGAMTLTVNGSGFIYGCTGQYNGSNRATTFISTSQVTLALLTGDTATAGSYSVTVTNAGAAASNSLTFTIGIGTPTLTSLSPSSEPAGGSSFTLTVVGTNFQSTSVVQWNGAALTTTYVSSTQLTATVPSTDITMVGTATVTVQ